MNRCYRVWFRDGTAVLVDALNMAEAKGKALDLYNGWAPVVITKIECLDSD